MDNVGPKTETAFGGAAGLFSGEAWIWNELAVGASFCFLNMVELLAMRFVSLPSAAMIGLSPKRTATHLTVPEISRRGAR
jgi:hypothetical protein